MKGTTMKGTRDALVKVWSNHTYYYQLSYSMYACEMYYKPSINGLSRNFNSRSDRNLINSLIDCHYINNIRINSLTDCHYINDICTYV